MNRYDEFEEIQKNWSPPAELMTSTPRPVRLTTGGRALTALGCALFAGAIAGGIMLGSQVARQEQRHRLLAEQGISVEAAITRLWRTSGDNPRYRVAYAYDLEGRSYRSDTNVPHRIWRNLKEGDALAVRVVPSKPEWSHPRDWDDQRMPAFVAVLVPVFLVGPGCLVFWAIRRQKSLIEEGRAAPAIITGKKVHHSHGGNQTMVRYEFRLLGGGIAKGRSSAPRKGGEVGSVVSIVYLPENPRRSALYPLDLARPGE